MSRDSKEFIVGLDIGTTKIVALVAEFRQIGHWIARVVDSQLDEHAIAAIAEETHALCADFPMP